MAEVDFEEHFENGNLDQFRLHGGGQPGAVSIVSDPDNTSNNVLRIRNEIGKDNSGAESPWDVPGLHRFELALPNIKYIYDEDYWVGMRVQPHESWPTTNCNGGRYGLEH